MTGQDPAPARQRHLSKAQREEWWRRNQHRVDELLRSPDNVPRTGGVENPKVGEAKPFYDKSRQATKSRPSDDAVDRRNSSPSKAGSSPSTPSVAAPTPSTSNGIVTVDGMRFGPWLRRKRIERGMSQGDVTKLAGCSHARIGQLELEWGGPAQRMTPLVRKLIQLFREES